MDTEMSQREVATLAATRGYSLVNQGVGYWLVHRATMVPELNEKRDSLSFSLSEAQSFLDGNIP